MNSAPWGPCFAYSALHQQPGWAEPPANGYSVSASGQKRAPRWWAWRRVASQQRVRRANLSLRARRSNAASCTPHPRASRSSKRYHFAGDSRKRHLLLEPVTRRTPDCFTGRCRCRWHGDSDARRCLDLRMARVFPDRWFTWCNRGELKALPGTELAPLVLYGATPFDECRTKVTGWATPSS
jgi:hypothetical protein